MKVAIALLALLGLCSAASIPQGRIIGGQNAVAGQFPYMASLRNANGAHFCGGAIYNTRWVLSAAHCTIGRQLSNTLTHIGSQLFSEGGVTHRSLSVANHPNYNANTLENDISMIWTAEPMVFSPTVRAIPISTTNIGSGVVAVVSGWGLVRNPGYNPEILQWVQKSTISNLSCRNAHSLGNRSRINSSNLCTNNPNGVGTCTGDNGGPLTAGDAIIGLFSWSVPCAQGLPDVYTRISSHVAWINLVSPP